MDECSEEQGRKENGGVRDHEAEDGYTRGVGRSQGALHGLDHFDLKIRQPQKCD